MGGIAGKGKMAAGIRDLCRRSCVLHRIPGRTLHRSLDPEAGACSGAPCGCIRGTTDRIECRYRPNSRSLINHEQQCTSPCICAPSAPCLLPSVRRSVRWPSPSVIFPLISGPLSANIDPDKIGELGDNIARGRGFVYGSGDTTVTAFDRAPLYPLIVAFFRGTLGDRFAVGLQVLQALLHGLTGLIVYRIGREVFDIGRRCSHRSFMPIHPVMLWYTARVWIETTNTLLTALVVLMVVLLQNEATARRAVPYGSRHCRSGPDEVGDPVPAGPLHSFCTSPEEVAMPPDHLR